MPPIDLARFMAQVWVTTAEFRNLESARPMIRPTFEEFQELAKRGNIVPVYRELLADMETPVSVFRKLDLGSEYAFLLESVEQGEQVGRYSFLGVDPAVIFRVCGNRQEILAVEGDLEPRETPIATLRFLLSRYKPVEDPSLPPFIGGAVGYMSYDTVRYYENIPDTCEDDLKLPDCFIMIAESVIAFDHVRHRMDLIVNARVNTERKLHEVYTTAIMQLAFLEGRLHDPFPETHHGARREEPAAKRISITRNFLEDYLATQRSAEEKPAPGNPFGLSLNVFSNTRQSEYEEMVRKAKEYITAGDIFQVVLSQRFTADITCDPFNVYRALRAVNPSPYMFYLKCGKELQLAGSSPELLSKLVDGKVITRPIAGTRPRGKSKEEDLALEKDLLADEKERAEHVMLVDLGRNDIGRVTEYGTVTVDDFMVIERYSHVMHIVSNVTGDISGGRDGLDVLAATFPAGTLSGAPKIRAMEIIDELEKNRRGPYGGAVVYLSFDGTMDSCITIRTAVITGNEVHVQAGAGIVADSDPTNEYTECVNKAKGMLKAIEMAENGLE